MGCIGIEEDEKEVWWGYEETRFFRGDFLTWDSREDKGQEDRKHDLKVDRATIYSFMHSIFVVLELASNDFYLVKMGVEGTRWEWAFVFFLVYSKSTSFTVALAFEIDTLTKRALEVLARGAVVVCIFR